MALRGATLLVLSLLHFCSPHSVSRPTNWLRQCQASTDSSVPALEVLPGGGWDNLRNLDMGRVMNLSYSQCQTTEDGLYFIPDEVFVIPRKVTGAETHSEIIMSWLDHRSATAFSINMDMSFQDEDVAINAKFSAENQRMKTHQVRDASVTARTQIRNFLYTVKANPDFTLDSRFAWQLEAIANSIENNRTRNAAYLSEKMVLDYGTHVITSVDAGAILAKEDYLQSSYISDSDTSKSSITAQAGISLFQAFKYDISAGFSSNSSDLSAYEGNTTYSLMESHGGAPFYPGITLQSWQESISNNLVGIDRSGLPLYYFINPTTLPDLPEPTVRKVALSVQKAIERYYTINTHPGCVQLNAKNFNFQANKDDGSCEGPATNLSFAGVYQECTAISSDADPLCQSLAQKNPDTGDYSCRPPYRPTLLHSEVKEESYMEKKCHRQHYSCGFLGLWDCSDTVCVNIYRVRSAKIHTYWCSSNETSTENTGFLFGGLYGPTLQNPITKSKNCPLNFIQTKFLSNGMFICLSDDYETGPKYSVPFGGLFSCESTNPLAGGQRRCPPQFSQHLATVSDGCEILYCVQSGLFTGGQLHPVRLPPFTRPPLLSAQATNTVMVMTQEDKSWVRVGGTEMWQLAKPEDIRNMARKFDIKTDQMSGGLKTGVAFGVIVLVVLVVLGALAVLKKKGKLSSCHRVRGGYDNMDSMDVEESETRDQSTEEEETQPIVEIQMP